MTENEPLMNQHCPHEAQVLRAIRSGELPLWSVHLESCSECRSLLAVVRALTEEAGQARLQAQPPYAQAILLRARIRSRQAAAARATLPLRWAARLGYVAACLLALAWLISIGPTEVFGVPPGGGSQPAGLLIAIAAVPAMLLVTAVLRILWAED